MDEESGKAIVTEDLSTVRGRLQYALRVMEKATTGALDPDDTNLTVVLEGVQVAVPFALDSEILLRKEDAEVVLQHIEQAAASGYDDYTAATKLANTFGNQSAHLFAVRLTKPCLLTVEAFRRRLDAMCRSTPSLLYRALGAMGYIGDGAASTAGDSVALRYARYVEATFERGVSTCS